MAANTRPQVLIDGHWRDVAIIYNSRAVCGLLAVGPRGWMIDATCFEARRALGCARHVRTLTDASGSPLVIVDPEAEA